MSLLHGEILLDGYGKLLNDRALPILRRFGVEAVRPAFALYNSFGDADRLIEALRDRGGLNACVAEPHLASLVPILHHSNVTPRW